MEASCRIRDVEPVRELSASQQTYRPGDLFWLRDVLQQAAWWGHRGKLDVLRTLGIEAVCQQ